MGVYNYTGEYAREDRFLTTKNDSHARHARLGLGDSIKDTGAAYIG